MGNKREAGKHKARTKPQHVGHKRTQDKARIATRRIQVSELLLQGQTYRQIANELGVRSTETIHGDVQAIIADWQAEQKRNIEEWIALEVSRIGRIEVQAWEGWERSLQDAKTVSHETSTITIKSGRGGAAIEVPALQSKETRTTRGQAGDPRFLERALQCVVKRCELLGLDKPKKLEHTWREEAERAGLNPNKIIEDLTNGFVSLLAGSGSGGSLDRGQEESGAQD